MSATKFIRLTLPGGEPVYVNADLIFIFYPHNRRSEFAVEGANTEVVGGSADRYPIVRETCDQICARLGIAP